MMQAAANPLVNMLGRAANAATPPAAAQGKAASGFAALFADGQGPQRGEGAGPQNPLMEGLKGLLPALDDLKTAVASTEGLSEEVTEDILETLDQLSALLGDLIEGEPIDAEKLAAFLPEGMAETLMSQGEGTPFGQVSPMLLVHVLQQASLSIVEDLNGAVASGDTPLEMAKGLNLGGLISAIAKVQAGPRPQLPGQHPVAISSRLGQFGETLSQTTTDVTAADGEGLVQGLTQAALGDNAAKPFGEFVQQIATSAAHAAGAIEIPRDMVQIIPEEVVSALQAASETQSANQAQQAGRPDAPQAKFTQAGIGQLRAVDIQEGTTKVELNPRGLGSVEIEMKTNADGSLSVVVRAESAHVLSSLREERELLAQIIAQGGDASVDFQEFTSSDQQGFEENNGFAGSAPSVESGEEVVETSQADTIGNGQLDLMT